MKIHFIVQSGLKQTFVQIIHFKVKTIDVKK